MIFLAMFFAVLFLLFMINEENIKNGCASIIFVMGLCFAIYYIEQILSLAFSLLGFSIVIALSIPFLIGIVGFMLGLVTGTRNFFEITIEAHKKLA